MSDKEDVKNKRIEHFNDRAKKFIDEGYRIIAFGVKGVEATCMIQECTDLESLKVCELVFHELVPRVSVPKEPTLIIPGRRNTH